MQTASESEIDVSRLSPGMGRRRWLEVALIFAVFFILAGDPAPHVNEAHYLTKAKHYWNPSWLAGDFFLESADAHLMLYWTLGWLTKLFSLTTVAWIGRLVAWLLLAISWQRLSSRVVGAPFVSVLAAALFVTMLAENNFAGEWVVGGVEGKCFAYALVFWGLAAICAGRWRLAWPLLGLASAFHVLVGGWSTISALYIWLREPRADRPRLLTMLPSLVLGAVFALPGVVPGLQLTANVPAEVCSEANQIYVFDRLPHHLAPLALPSDELLRKVIRFGKLVLSFFALWAAFRIVRRRAVSPATSQAAGTSELDIRDSGLTRLFRFGEASLILCLLGVSWELATWNQPALAASLLKYYWFRLADVAIPLAVCFAIAWFVHRLIQSHSKWAIFALLLAAAYPGWYLVDISMARWDRPVPPTDRRLRNPLAWKEACEWAYEKTDPDAMFLVPRSSSSFKWYAHRKDLVTRKDIPQDANSLLGWRDRYFDVFWYTDEFGEQQLYRSLASQGTERIQQLAEKYAIDYVLTNEYPPLSLPVVFANEAFTIYATSPTAQATTP
ncbi:MAG: hypothetical protein GXP26_14030 [Planctomycetes bacterium]|nr:hypothetical protein [Planctomycetota bacterium]